MAGLSSSFSLHRMGHARLRYVVGDAETVTERIRNDMIVFYIFVGRVGHQKHIQSN